MSEFSIDPVTEALASQVLAAGQQIRLTQHAERRALAQLAERRAAHEGSVEYQLVTAVGRLALRMEQVANRANSRRGRWRNRGLLPVTKEGFDYITAALTDGDIARLSGDHLVFSGVTFSREIGHVGSRHVAIEQQVRDESTGATKQRLLHSLFVYAKNGIWRVHDEVGPGIAYRQAMRERAAADYVATHPWATELLSRFWEIDDHRRGIKADNGAIIWQSRPGQAQTEKEQHIQQMNTELIPQYYPGNSWEYPPEIFIEPLTRVMQANILLGVTK